MTQFRFGNVSTWDRYVEFHARAPFKHIYLAWIGLFTYPGYYIIWTYIAPQPYENIALRLAGCAFCAATLCREHWPERIKPYYFPLSYIFMMASLPIFFTYMTLMNGANTLWLMSTMAAFLFVVLVYDIVNSFIVTLLGSAIGILIFYIVDGVQPLPINYVLCFPILLFAVVAVVFLSYSERLVSDEQFSAAKLLASNIAHEMRTPLLGIRLDCERVRQDLLELSGNKADHPPISANFPNLHLMMKALERIHNHTSSANHVIDMLLANVNHRRIIDCDVGIFSVHTIVASALDRYPFRKGERDCVHIHGSSTAQFHGSDTLLTHVFFNLLKNSLNAIEAKGDGNINITIFEHKSSTRIEFADSGNGIPEDLLPFIFMPFVTGGQRMHGTGIGLAFSKLVVESSRGTITCLSKEGVGTTFVIELPQPSRPLESEATTNEYSVTSTRYQAAAELD